MLKIKKVVLDDGTEVASYEEDSSPAAKESAKEDTKSTKERPKTDDLDKEGSNQ